MWVDHLLTGVEKVTVLKLEAEQMKLRLTILSLTATLRNAQGKESKLMQQLESGINDEIEAILFITIMMVN